MGKKNFFTVNNTYKYRVGTDFGIKSENISGITQEKNINNQFIKKPQRHASVKKRNIIPRLTNEITLFLQKYSYYLWLFICILLGFVLCIRIINLNLISLQFPSSSIIDEAISVEQAILIEQDESVLTEEDISNKSFTEVELINYILQPGDVLLRIAAKYNKKIDTLVSWNNIKDARRIRAGDTIIIPSKDGILHTVRNGETLNTISKKYNITSVNILDANNLSSNTLIVGSKLFIPGAVMDEFELGLVLGTVFLAPTRGVISSYYGYRTSPITGIWSFHGGIDIANNTGVLVNAASYGTVIYVSYTNNIYGKVVIIQHPNGFQSLYAHLDDIYVKKGQYVSRGKTIGVMGNTGLSTGPHLHFTLILNGQTVNPLRYVRF